MSHPTVPEALAKVGVACPFYDAGITTAQENSRNMRRRFQKRSYDTQNVPGDNARNTGWRRRTKRKRTSSLPQGRQTCAQSSATPWSGTDWCLSQNHYKAILSAAQSDIALQLRCCPRDQSRPPAVRPGEGGDGLRASQNVGQGWKGGSARHAGRRCTTEGRRQRGHGSVREGGPLAG